MYSTLCLLELNLLSLNEMWRYIDSLSKTEHGLRFKQGQHEFQATIKSGLLILDTIDRLTSIQFSAAVYSIEDLNLRLWHERLAHLSEKSL